MIGLLGINLAGIPEAQNSTAFWLVCGFLLGVAVLALILIRRQHWMQPVHLYRLNRRC